MAPRSTQSPARKPRKPAAESPSTGARTTSDRLPQNHRTVDRVTRILEEVVYSPGMTLAELVRALNAPKSSVHGFIRGLLAKGWLHQEAHRFYLGPTVYGLTLASGHIRAGLVTQQDLAALSTETGLPAYLGVQAGDHLIYVAEAGSDPVGRFDARSSIRRTMLMTAGGKALLAELRDAERDAYLRRRSKDEAEMVDQFLDEYQTIKATGIATNFRRNKTRFAIATAVHNPSSDPVASITLVGPTANVQPRLKELSEVLRRHVDAWSHRAVTPREAV